MRLRMDQERFDVTRENIIKWSGEEDVKLFAHSQPIGDDGFPLSPGPPRFKNMLEGHRASLLNPDYIYVNIKKNGIQKKTKIDIEGFEDIELLLSIVEVSHNCWSLNINNEPFILLTNEGSNISNLNITESRHLLSIGNLDVVKLDRFKYLETINILAPKIKEIKTFPFIKSLIKIDLSKCKQLKNVDCLQNLVNLKNINLVECSNILNVDGLLNLKSLEELNLNKCENLVNIDGLINQERIIKLNVEMCKNLQNLDGLKNLTALQNLRLIRCESLINVDGLRNQKKLKVLDTFECRSLQNIDGLKSIISLEVLKIRGVFENYIPIQNIDGLKNLTNITELELSNCSRLENVDELNKLNKLNKLKIKNCNNLQNIDGLKGLINLEKLNLSCGFINRSNLQSIDGLKNLTNLKELVLRNCSIIRRGDELDNLINITNLDLSSSNELWSIDSLQNMKKLENLNLSNCNQINDFGVLKYLTCIKYLDLRRNDLIQNLNIIKNLSSLLELHLSKCINLQNINTLKNLKNLSILNIENCPSIKNIDILSECKPLSDLRHESPYLSTSILVSSAYLRKDIEYIKNKSGNWIQLTEKTPELEPLTSRMVKAVSLINDTQWRIDNLIQLLRNIILNNDLSLGTLENILSEGLKTGYQNYSSLFEILSNQNNIKTEFISTAVFLLSDIENEAKEWASSYVSNLIGEVEDDKKRALAPSVCVFYSSLGKDSLVKEWLESSTLEASPVWKDRIYTSLSRFYLNKGDIKQAKDKLNEIKTSSEKDIALTQFAEQLAENSPIEAGVAFGEISGTIRKFTLAEKLMGESKFTADLSNVYRLFLTLGSDPDKLSKLIDKLIEQHPDSEVVKELISQYDPKSVVFDDMLPIIEEFLNSDLIIKNTKETKLIKFKDSLLNNNDKKKSALLNGILTLLEEDGLIEKDELDEMKKSLEGDK